FFTSEIDSSSYLFISFILFSLRQVFLSIRVFLDGNLPSKIIYYSGLILITCGIFSFVSIGSEESGGIMITLFSIVPFCGLVLVFELTQKKVVRA
ncbi:MAG: hypothetical protein KDB79_03660, partial [Acidobacteria bacterium]|nr:hypothetical protein [Acidobacteriota bacterium]